MCRHLYCLVHLQELETATAWKTAVYHPSESVATVKLAKNKNAVAAS